MPLTSYHSLTGPQGRAYRGYQGRRYESPLATFNTRGIMRQASEPADIPASKAVSESPSSGDLVDKEPRFSNGEPPASDLSGREMGPFSKDALEGVVEGSALKAGANMGLATVLGSAPLGAAAKFALSSVMTPVAGLGLIAKTAYGGLLDESYSNDLKDIGVDVSSLDANDVEAAREAQDTARSLGMHQSDAFEGLDPGVAEAASVRNRYEDIGVLGRFGKAKDAFLGKDWGKTTIDPETGLQVDLARKTQLNPVTRNMVHMGRGSENDRVGEVGNVGIGGGINPGVDSAVTGIGVGRSIADAYGLGRDRGGQGMGPGGGGVSGGGRAGSDAGMSGEADAGGLGGGGAGYW